MITKKVILETTMKAALILACALAVPAMAQTVTVSPAPENPEVMLVFINGAASRMDFEVAGKVVGQCTLLDAKPDEPYQVKDCTLVEGHTTAELVNAVLSTMKTMEQIDHDDLAAAQESVFNFRQLADQYKTVAESCISDFRKFAKSIRELGNGHARLEDGNGLSVLRRGLPGANECLYADGRSEYLIAGPCHP